MGRLERQKLKKETPSIEQTVILNLTDFMHMSHPVRFSSSSAFKYYVILLPLRVQEPVWKWKGFLFEISLYNKEGRKIQCSDLRYPLMVILKKKSISLSSLITWGSPIQLQKTVPDASKLQKKAYKLRGSLTVGKILLLFSTCLSVHSVHKCTAIGKITCLRNLIGICFTAFLLPVVPLASCFDCSGNKILFILSTSRRFSWKWI